jgi:peroxiredoxin
MKQIVDLENDRDFHSLNVGLVSIARDPIAELAAAGQEAGVTNTPLLSDPNNTAAKSYDVLQYAVKSGEPSHTFVLVGQDGKIIWTKDYGSPDNPNQTMYVPVAELVAAIRQGLK